MSLTPDHNKGAHDWYWICQRIQELYPNECIYAIIFKDDYAYEVTTAKTQFWVKLEDLVKKQDEDTTNHAT